MVDLLLTIAELKEQIELGLATPLYTVTVSGQQRLYARSCKQAIKPYIVYAVVI